MRQDGAPAVRAWNAETGSSGRPGDRGDSTGPSFLPPDSKESLHRAVHRDQARHLLEQSRVAERLNLVAAVVVAAILVTDLPAATVIAWSAVVVLATLARTHARRTLTAAQARPARIMRVMRIRVGILGLAWGLGTIALAPSMEMEHLGMLMMLAAGLTAGAISSLAADRRSFQIYAVCLLGPLALAAVLADQAPQHVTAAMLILVFGAACVQLSRQPSRVLRTALMTARRLGHAQRANQSERAFLNALMQSAPTAIVAVDPAGQVMAANPAFQQLFGWAPAEAVGRVLDELVVPTERRARAEHLFERVHAGEVVEEHVRRVRRDGLEVPVRVSAAPIRDAEAGAVLVLYEDRTAEEQAYDALRQAEQHYRNLVESSTDLVWKVDLQGRWTFLNAAATDLYQMSPADLVGAHFVDRVEPDRRAADAEALQSVFDGHTLNDYETRHRAFDGSVRHLSFSARPIRDSSGTVTGAQGTARDVSERAAVRSALEEAHGLAQDNARNKSAFLANMSHEIRTPMNGVIGMADVLMETDLTAEQHRATEVIQSSAHALLTLIDDILDFSKLESGALTIERLAFEVTPFVDTTVNLFEHEARKRGLTLSSRVDPDVPDWVQSDPGRLRQVVTNLLGNALKFTHAGRITLSLGTEPAANGSRLVFEVADTGIGIPEDKLHTIFEEFSQADASTTRQYGGTGLGLAISKRIAQAMGGDLTVASEPGAGSVFRFSVPLVEAPTPAAPTAHRPRQLAGTRALVAAWRPGDRASVREALEEVGAQVVECSAIQDVLALLQERADRPDVLVTDRRLEDGDAFELAERLGGTPDLAGLPVVLVASHPRLGEGRRCKDLGIEGYVPRPFRRADLLESVAQCLDLPTRPPPAPRLVTRHSIAETRRALNILLVEDNPLNQEVATALLSRRGHSVQVVDGGLEAVERCKEDRPDLILMDIQLPDIDGVEATRRIRDAAWGRDVPILALTAHALQEERDRALGAGMNGYLSKPFRPHKLFAMVEGWGTPDADRPPSEDDGPIATVPVDIEGFRAEMREAGVEAVVDESVALFVDTTPARLEELTRLAAEGDLKALRREAHALKSPAGILKAQRFHALLDTLENETPSQPGSWLSEHVDKTVRAGLEAVQYLVEHEVNHTPAEQESFV